MKKEVLYTIPSLYRDDFRVEGFRFGEGEKALAIVGSMRGNEYQQMYIASRLVEKLRQLEASGMLIPGKEILVIPCVNPGSMNIEKRFWPTDNTDINRMFPGYELGETTQRIAAGVFEVVSAYKNGVQFASFYMPGNFCPHVRIMKTGYENVKKARQFCLPYIVLKVPRPYDTTTLNYNWQIWETDAFSLYSTTTSQLDEDSAAELTEGILHFMAAEGILSPEVLSEGETKCRAASQVISDRDLISVRPDRSGIFRSMAKVRDHVKKGQVLAEILDPCEGRVTQQLYAPKDGVIFFLHDKPLVYANTAVIKLLA